MRTTIEIGESTVNDVVTIRAADADATGSARKGKEGPGPKKRAETLRVVIALRASRPEVADTCERRSPLLPGGRLDFIILGRRHLRRRR